MRDLGAREHGVPAGLGVEVGAGEPGLLPDLAPDARRTIDSLAPAGAEVPRARGDIALAGRGQPPVDPGHEARVVGLQIRAAEHRAVLGLLVEYQHLAVPQRWALGLAAGGNRVALCGAGAGGGAGEG